jgi:hypothetical protein
MNLDFREPNNQIVHVEMWTEALPSHGLQLWYAKALIAKVGEGERVIQFEIPDVPAPGSWNHLTARFFARYPEVDRYGDTMLPHEEQIRRLLQIEDGPT